MLENLARKDVKILVHRKFSRGR